VEAASEGDGLRPAGPLAGEAAGDQGLNQRTKAGVTGLDFLCTAGSQLPRYNACNERVCAALALCSCACGVTPPDYGQTHVSLDL